MKKALIALIEVVMFILALVTSIAWLYTGSETAGAFTLIFVIAMIATIAELDEEE